MLGKFQTKGKSSFKKQKMTPGKLRARPVQHPATPALMTAEEKLSKYQSKIIIKHKYHLWLTVLYHHPFLGVFSRCK